MALSDPLGDMLTRIRNGQKAGLSAVTSPASKLRANMLTCSSYPRLRVQVPSFIELGHEGHPVIREIKRISTPAVARHSKIAEPSGL
jgi:small subunit ribosomal protein S8